MSAAAEACRKAMKGFGTDEKALIATLSKLDPIQVAALKTQYNSRFQKDLFKDIEKETSGYFEFGLLAIIRGPLAQDCFMLERATHGLGTREFFLNEILLGRSNADLNAIKSMYRTMFRRTLESDIKSDLSAKTERLFDMVMAARRAEDAAPVIPHEIDRDVQDLHRATEGQKLGTDQMTVCQILSSRNDNQIRAIGHAYEQKFHKPLRKVIAGEVSGHMEDALLLMLDRGMDRAKADAGLLYGAMKGMGTKDEQLVHTVVKIHWNRQHMQQVRGAYKHHYKTDLVSAIKSETSGDYERLMVACVEV
jgi:annexin A7/11